MTAGVWPTSAGLSTHRSSDIFDVRGYIRFTLAPMARAERVETAKATGVDGYEEEMRQFLDYLLGSYAKDGSVNWQPSV